MARRVDVFRRQLEEWTRASRPGVPLLVLPSVAQPRDGECFSCAEPREPERTWRCRPCEAAVRVVLEVKS